MGMRIGSPASLARAMCRSIGVALLLLLGAGAACADTPAALTEPVVDRTGTLTATGIAALRAKVDAIAARKGSQVAVLMVESTQPQSIEAYSLAVAEATRLGRAGVDDGVLIVVAKDDRAARIEVGRGLEGAIPDAIASRIIREYLGPRFRAGDFAGGLGDAIDAIGRLIDGEPLPPPLDAPPGEGVPPLLDVYLGVFLGALVAAFVGGFGLRRGGRVALASGIAAVISGAMLKTLFAIVAATAAAAVFSLFDSLGRRGGIIGPRGRGRGGWGGGGTFGGTSGGGWSSGSGGGWSGGGGSFGGGGASGRW